MNLGIGLGITSAAIIGGGAAGGDNDMILSKTVSQFNTDTTNGTANSYGSQNVAVYLTDGLYACVWNGSAWDYYFQGHKCTPPVSGDFSWVNQGTSTVDTTAGGVYLTGELTNATSLRMRTKSLGSLPITYTMGFLFAGLGANVLTTCGMVLRESATSKLVTHAVAASPVTGFYHSYSYATATTDPAAIVQYAHGQQMVSQGIWLRTTIDSSNRTMYFSVNGIHWHQWSQATRTANFTTAPNQIGFFVNSHNAAYQCGIHLFHWSES